MLMRVLVADNGLPSPERKACLALAQELSRVGHNVGFRLLDIFDVNEPADLVVLPRISPVVDKLAIALSSLGREFVLIGLLPEGSYRVAMSSGHSVRSLEELAEGLYFPQADPEPEPEPVAFAPAELIAPELSGPSPVFRRGRGRPKR